MTKNATEAISNSARAMPEGKLTLSVLDEGRTALDLLQECAQSPMWFAQILENRAAPEFDEAAWEEATKQCQQWQMLDACEQACKENSEMLYKIIQTFLDEELLNEISLPFGENFVASFADICMFQYWNLTYHWGQINFIQTLYGDKDMH
jgi:uncharacterized damage-inducible protein DinB